MNHAVQCICFWGGLKFVVIKIQSVPHRKHYVSATKPNRLMLFRETVAVYCENHTEHTYTVWAEYRVFSVKAGGTYNNQWHL
jgi:hypothetical protein